MRRQTRFSGASLTLPAQALEGRQSALLRAMGAAWDQARKVLKDVGVNAPATLTVQNGHHLLVRPWCMVGAGGCHGVIAVDHGDDSGGDGNVLAAEPVGIAQAVV